MNLQVFSNSEFGELSVFEIDGKLYFPATRCAEILGYKNPNKAVGDHCRDLTKREVIDALGRTQATNIIPEGDLYRLIIRSRLPSAERFEKWVFDEVLPQIRKTGGYIPVQAEDDEKTILSRAVLIAQRTIEEKDGMIARQKERLAIAEPKAEYCDNVLLARNVYPVTVLAKEYGMTAPAFNELLKNHGIQFKVGGTWVLTHKYANQGYTQTKTYYINDNRSNIQTLWTQKGRKFLYDLLKARGLVPVSERQLALAAR